MNLPSQKGQLAGIGLSLCALMLPTFCAFADSTPTTCECNQASGLLATNFSASNVPSCCSVKEVAAAKKCCCQPQANQCACGECTCGDLDSSLPSPAPMIPPQHQVDVVLVWMALDDALCFLSLPCGSPQPRLFQQGHAISSTAQQRCVILSRFNC